jgi:hypothetical protein
MSRVSDKVYHYYLSGCAESGHDDIVILVTHQHADCQIYALTRQALLDGHPFINSDEFRRFVADLPDEIQDQAPAGYFFLVGAFVNFTSVTLVPKPSDDELRLAVEIRRGIHEVYRRAKMTLGYGDVVVIVWPNPEDDRVHATAAARADVLASGDDFSKSIGPMIRQPPPAGSFWVAEVEAESGPSPTSWPSARVARLYYSPERSDDQG